MNHRLESGSARAYPDFVFYCAPIKVRPARATDEVSWRMVIDLCLGVDIAQTEYEEFSVVYTV